MTLERKLANDIILRLAAIRQGTMLWASTSTTRNVEGAHDPSLPFLPNLQRFEIGDEQACPHLMQE